MSTIWSIINWEVRSNGECTKVAKKKQPTRIGLFLKEELDRRGIPVKHFEEITGLSDTTIKRILDGTTQDPRASYIGTIAEGLGMTPLELFRIGGYINGSPDDPDAESLRLAEVMRARPGLLELAREAETLDMEELDATVAFIVTIRKKRTKYPKKRRQSQADRRPPEDRQSPPQDS